VSSHSGPVSLLISSDYPPVTGGQSRYLYDLWSLWPQRSVVVLAPSVAGAEAVDARLPCEVVRVRLPLGEGLVARLIKPLLLLRAAQRLCLAMATSATIWSR
jgi:hypothetical protein